MDDDDADLVLELPSESDDEGLVMLRVGWLPHDDQRVLNVCAGVTKNVVYVFGDNAVTEELSAGLHVQSVLVSADPAVEEGDLVPDRTKSNGGLAFEPAVLVIPMDFPMKPGPNTWNVPLVEILSPAPASLLLPLTTVDLGPSPYM
ncbi:hypothetical protein EV1_012497 [Malus domestica]